MKYTKKILRYLGISAETDDAYPYCVSTESLGKVNRESSNQDSLNLVHLDDDNAWLRLPNFLLAQTLCHQDTSLSTSHNAKSNGKRPTPHPIEVDVKVITQSPGPEDRISVQGAEYSWSTTDTQIQSDVYGFYDTVKTVASLSKPCRLRKIKNKICQLFCCCRKGSTKRPNVSQSAIIDDVTTLHVLHGDEEAESGISDPIRRLRRRRPGLYM